MNVTKDVIIDLYPLYLEKECSADTMALVEEYLQRHPQDAAQLRRVMSAPLPKVTPPAKDLDEAQSLREARRAVRRRSWLMGLAIFFSVAPFSFVVSNERSWWMLRDAPGSALVYVALGVLFWIVYVVQRRRSGSV